MYVLLALALSGRVQKEAERFWMALHVATAWIVDNFFKEDFVYISPTRKFIFLSVPILKSWSILMLFKFIWLRAILNCLKIFLSIHLSRNRRPKYISMWVILKLLKNFFSFYMSIYRRPKHVSIIYKGVQP